MTARTLAVVTAGLSQPSSTRLLADRLTEATVRALDRMQVEVTVVELRDVAQDVTNNSSPVSQARGLTRRYKL